MLYQEAIKRGLSDDHLKEALVCQASSFRVIGKLPSAVKYIKITKRKFPDDLVVLMFYALIMFHKGDAAAAVKDQARIVITRAGDDLGGYKQPLSRYYKRIRRQKNN